MEREARSTNHGGPAFDQLNTHLHDLFSLGRFHVWRQGKNTGGDEGVKLTLWPVAAGKWTLLPARCRENIDQRTEPAVGGDGSPIRQDTPAFGMLALHVTQQHPDSIARFNFAWRSTQHIQT